MVGNKAINKHRLRPSSRQAPKETRSCFLRPSTPINAQLSGTNRLCERRQGRCRQQGTPLALTGFSMRLRTNMHNVEREQLM